MLSRSWEIGVRPSGQGAHRAATEPEAGLLPIGL